MTKLRLMSNNIWNRDENTPAWAERGDDCSAEARLPNLFRIYEDTLPDVIGQQECSLKMADLMMRRFAEKEMPYTMLWGKFTPIIYRTDKFEVVDAEYRLYPVNLPGREGSFNDAASKSYSLAALRVKESGKLILFAATHLWWKSGDPGKKNYQPYSAEAREYQIRMLIARVDAWQAKYNCPAIIVGDLNSGIHSLALKAAFAAGFAHAHDLAADYRDETMGVHYCHPDRYEKLPYPRKFDSSIDHILMRGMPDGAVRRFCRYAPAYYMAASDHFPVWADIEL